MPIKLLIALALAWVAFYPAIQGAFVWDDHGLPFTSPNAATMPFRAWIAGVRPLLMASYWLNFKWAAPGSTFPYHAFNVCAHAIAAVLVWICASRVLEIARVPSPRKRLLAGLVAALFLVHPLQTESVDYIAGRSEVLTGVFFFGAFAMFLQSPARWWRVPSIIVLFIAAVLSKEHALVILALFVMTDLFWREGSFFARLRENRILYWSLAPIVLAGAGMVLHVLLSAPTAGFKVVGLSWWEYFCTQWRVIPEYMRLFVLPLGQNVDWMFPRSHSLLDHYSLVYGVALAASVIAAIRFRARAPLAAYGYLVFLLLLLPTSSFVPIQDVLAERRMYLPIFGAGLLTAAALSWPSLGETGLKCVIALVLVLGGALSWERSKVWRSPLDLWADATEQAPGNLRARINLGNALLGQGMCADAAREYETVKRLQPTLQNPKMDLGLASAYGCQNDFVRQRKVLQSVAQRQPTADLMTDLGVLAAKAGDVQEATSDFDQAIRLAPGVARAWALRGLLDVATHTGDAESDFGRALALDPSNEIARNGIAQLHAAPTQVKASR